MALVAMTMWALAFPVSPTEEESSVLAATNYTIHALQASTVTVVSSKGGVAMAAADCGTPPFALTTPCNSYRNMKCALDGKLAACEADLTINPWADDTCTAEEQASQCANVPTEAVGNDCMTKFNTLALTTCAKLCKWKNDGDFETGMDQFQGWLGPVGTTPVVGDAFDGLIDMGMASHALDADNWAVTGITNTELTLTLAACIGEETKNLISMADVKNHLHNYQELVSSFSVLMGDMWVTGYPHEREPDYCTPKCPPRSRGAGIMINDEVRGPTCFLSEAKYMDRSSGRPVATPIEPTVETDSAGNEVKVCIHPDARLQARFGKYQKEWDGKCYYMDFGIDVPCNTPFAKDRREFQVDSLSHDLMDERYFEIMVEKHKRVLHEIFKAVSEDIPTKDNATDDKWTTWAEKFNTTDKAMHMLFVSGETVTGVMLSTLKQFNSYCNANEDGCKPNTLINLGHMLRTLDKDSDQPMLKPEKCKFAFKDTETMDYFDIIKNPQSLDEDGTFDFYPRSTREEDKLKKELTDEGLPIITHQVTFDSVLPTEHTGGTVSTCHMSSRDTSAAPSTPWDCTDSQTRTAYKLKGLTEAVLEDICEKVPYGPAIVKIDKMLYRQVRDVKAFGVDAKYNPFLDRKWQTYEEYDKTKSRWCGVEAETTSGDKYEAGTWVRWDKRACFSFSKDRKWELEKHLKGEDEGYCDKCVDGYSPSDVRPWTYMDPNLAEKVGGIKTKRNTDHFCTVHVFDDDGKKGGFDGESQDVKLEDAQINSGGELKGDYSKDVLGVCFHRDQVNKKEIDNSP